MAPPRRSATRRCPRRSRPSRRARKLQAGPYIPPEDIGGGGPGAPRHRQTASVPMSSSVTSSALPPLTGTSTMPAQPSIAPAPQSASLGALPTNSSVPSSPWCRAIRRRWPGAAPRRRLHPRHREWRVALHHRAPLRCDGAGDRVRPTASARPTRSLSASASSSRAAPICSPARAPAPTQGRRRSRRSRRPSSPPWPDALVEPQQDRRDHRSKAGRSERFASTAGRRRRRRPIRRRKRRRRSSR